MKNTDHINDTSGDGNDITFEVIPMQDMNLSLCSKFNKTANVERKNNNQCIVMKMSSQLKHLN